MKNSTNSRSISPINKEMNITHDHIAFGSQIKQFANQTVSQQDKPFNTANLIKFNESHSMTV